MNALGIRLGVLALVAAILPACGGGTTFSTGGPDGGVLGLSGTPVSGQTISLKGGNSSAANGGTGGSLAVSGNTAGAVGIVNAGAVDTSATLPPTAMPFLGDNPLVVAADGFLAIGVGNSTGGAAGAYLSNTGSGVTNAGGAVTGFWVQAGVTLTIQPNATAAGTFPGAGPHATASLSFPAGGFIEGLVVTPLKDSVAEGDAVGPDTANLTIGLATGGFVLTASGAIDLSGASNIAGPGANGGNASLAGADLNFAGQITTAGGPGSTSGGTGGSITLTANSGSAINTGPLTSDGGPVAPFLGGMLGGTAGPIQVNASTVSFVYNSGPLSAVGQPGPLGGGSGGSVALNSAASSVTNAAEISAWGGDAAASGGGGGGGAISMSAAGRVASLGALDCHGGLGQSGAGGVGGSLTFTSNNAALSDLGTLPPLQDSGGVYVAGSIKADGGDGAAGGGGAGSLTLQSDLAVNTNATGAFTAHVVLVGYASVDNSGGEGQVNGGSSASVTITGGTAMEATGNIMFAATTINQANITSRGGQGITGLGGSNSAVTFSMTTTTPVPASFPPLDNFSYGVENSGSYTGDGGAGTTGGAAASVNFLGYYFVTNSGAFSCQGGAGTTGGGGAGANQITLESSQNVTTSGAILAMGGSGTSGNGGGGPTIQIDGSQVSIYAPVSADGGPSSTGTGGAGGSITIFSNVDPSVITSTLSAAGGTGGVATAGTIFVDGAQVSGP